MAIPNSKEARRFFRCASQRRDEAQILLEAAFTTGAVYLAGYGVECVLKSLILSLTPNSQTTAALDLFRGAKAHDYDRLKNWYRQRGGAVLPAEITRAFTLVEDWSTELRYSTTSLNDRDARSFLKAVDTIMEWAHGRL